MGGVEKGKWWAILGIQITTKNLRILPFSASVYNACVPALWTNLKSNVYD